MDRKISKIDRFCRLAMRLSKEDKQTLIDRLSLSMEEGERVSKIRPRLEEIVGHPLQFEWRDRSAAYERAVYAYLARMAGCRLKEIGQMVHRDHSTVFYLISKVESAIAHPHEAPEINEIYNKYISRYGRI